MGWVGVVVGQFITLVLGQGSSRAGHPASSPLPSPPEWTLENFPWRVLLLQQWTRSRASFPILMSSGFSHNYTFNAISTTIPRCGIGSTLLRAEGEEGQLPLTLSYDHCYDLRASFCFCPRGSSKSTASRMQQNPETLNQNKETLQWRSKDRWIKVVLTDSLFHLTATVIRLSFPLFYLSFASYFLKFYCISLGGGRFQEQRVDNKGQGNEWDGDTYVKDTKNK